MRQDKWSVRHCFLLCRSAGKRGAVSGQDVGFQMEEEKFSMSLSGYIHFLSKRSRSDGTCDVVNLNRSCLLGNRSVTSCLWCYLTGSHYSKDQNSAMHFCCSDTFQ